MGELRTAARRNPLEKNEFQICQALPVIDKLISHWAYATKRRTSAINFASKNVIPTWSSWFSGVRRTGTADPRLMKATQSVNLHTTTLHVPETNTKTERIPSRTFNKQKCLLVNQISGKTWYRQ